jgi:hypothetical protein
VAGDLSELSVSNPTDSCVSAVKIVIKRANPDGGVGHAIRVII